MLESYDFFLNFSHWIYICLKRNTSIRFSYESLFKGIRRKRICKKSSLKANKWKRMLKHQAKIPSCSSVSHVNHIVDYQ